MFKKLCNIIREIYCLAVCSPLVDCTESGLLGAQYSYVGTLNSQGKYRRPADATATCSSLQTIVRVSNSGNSDLNQVRTTTNCDANGQWIDQDGGSATGYCCQRSFLSLLCRYQLKRGI